MIQVQTELMVADNTGAKKVESNAKLYNNQLKQCENKLNKKGLFGIFL